MTQSDLGYVRMLLEHGVIAAPVLELGTGYGGQTCRGEVTAHRLEYCGTDMIAGPEVDVVADFEDAATMHRFADRGPFGTVLILNVLEHTFDPVRVLDNACGLLRRGGKAIVLTPAVWPLHSYPFDSYRLLPNFYEVYARKRGVELDPKYFWYVGVGPVADHRAPNGEYEFPNLYKSTAKRFISRVVHRFFDTPGRGMMFRSHIAVAGVLTMSTTVES